MTLVHVRAVLTIEKISRCARLWLWLLNVTPIKMKTEHYRYPLVLTVKFQDDHCERCRSRREVNFSPNFLVTFNQIFLKLTLFHRPPFAEHLFAVSSLVPRPIALSASRQLWRLTSHPKPLKTSWNECVLWLFSLKIWNISASIVPCLIDESGNEFWFLYFRTPVKGYPTTDGSLNKSPSPANQTSSGDSTKENQCDTRQARRINEHLQNVKKALQMKRSSSSDL